VPAPSRSLLIEALKRALRERDIGFAPFGQR
jgi:hypothetical protein